MFLLVFYSVSLDRKIRSSKPDCLLKGNWVLKGYFYGKFTFKNTPFFNFLDFDFVHVLTT